MSYEIYRYIFIGGAVLSGIMLVVTILVFFLLKIPTVIGDLSGANARKAIENIRNQNESSGNKIYRSSTVNKERGKITDKISPSGRLIKKNTTGSLHGAMNTEKISTARLSPPQQSNETTVLGGNETTVLGGNETTVLGGNETTVLTPPAAPVVSAETTVLSNPAPVAAPVVAPVASGIFAVEYEITFIHTNEVIA